MKHLSTKINPLNLIKKSVAPMVLLIFIILPLTYTGVKMYNGELNHTNETPVYYSITNYA